MPEPNLPLSRFKVLDLTIARAGPTATRSLSDWGADVIKIEPPPSSEASANSILGARNNPDFQNLHRNKRSLVLNLKSDEGKAIFFRLCETADVIVENFRTEVKYRLGIDYEAVKQINPGIVYGSISGFGQDGPYGKRPGVDQIAQGMSGLMSITGEQGRGPMRVGIAISDSSAGILLANGILIALLDREVTGKGRWVHTSLLESMISMMDFQAARWTVAKDIPLQAGNDHPTAAPMGVYEAADGPVNIAASSGKMFRSFCKALNAPQLLENPDYASIGKRSLNRKALTRDINRVTCRLSQAELVEKLNDAGCPCGPINSVDQAFSDPQVQHLEISKPVDHPTLGQIGLIRMPINMPDIPGAHDIRRHAPDLGEDSDEILAAHGYSAEDIARLRSEGVI
ncbi:MAG: CaiB/BaiF CoA-transferase family protein [Desulfobacterales bacterium]